MSTFLTSACWGIEVAIQYMETDFHTYMHPGQMFFAGYALVIGMNRWWYKYKSEPESDLDIGPENQN